MSTHFEKVRIKEVRRETDDCVSILFDIPENLKELGIQFYMHQTKLLIFNGIQIVQWNLLEMIFDMKYDLANNDYISNLMTNKNQTLLTLDINGEIYIFSMETGMWISKYG